MKNTQTVLTDSSKICNEDDFGRELNLGLKKSGLPLATKKVVSPSEENEWQVTFRPFEHLLEKLQKPEEKPSDDQILANALFGDATFHAANFTDALEQMAGKPGQGIVKDISEDNLICSVCLVMIYLGCNEKFSHIAPMVFDEYKNLIGDHLIKLGIKEGEQLLRFLFDKLERNAMWLSADFEKEKVIYKICSGIGYLDNWAKCEPLVKKFVSDIESSMKRFGIIS